MAILDSLRHWAREMRVDGFRFDLASANTAACVWIHLTGSSMESRGWHCL